MNLFHRGNRGALRSAVAACVLAAAATVGLAGSTAGSGSEQPLGPADTAPVAQPGVQVADPVRVRVPSIGIDAPIGPLFVDDAGVLPPPDSFDATGWWRQGPEPGEVGPAVIAGHVDSSSGPAVFFRLKDIEPGQKIFVDRADGSTATFVARRTAVHPKDEFPTEAVYKPTSDAQLRLITCGGDFDSGEASYEDNVIVYATSA